MSRNTPFWDVLLSLARFGICDMLEKTLPARDLKSFADSRSAAGLNPRLLRAGKESMTRIIVNHSFLCEGCFRL